MKKPIKKGYVQLTPKQREEWIKSRQISEFIEDEGKEDGYGKT